MMVPGNRVLRPQLLILGAFVVGLVAVLTFAMNRQVIVTSSPTPSEERATLPPRPALTAAEEQYIRELWPIHGDVERSTMRMSLGQIFYTTQDLGRAELAPESRRLSRPTRRPRPGFAPWSRRRRCAASTRSTSRRSGSSRSPPPRC